MSRRAQIVLSPEEADRFLAEERTIVCATNGVRGWPHLMPLWYVLRPTGPDGASEVGPGRSRSPRRCATSSATRARRSRSRRAGSTRSCAASCSSATPSCTATCRPSPASASRSSRGTRAPARRATRARGRGDGARAGGQARGPAVRRAPAATWDHRKLGAGVYWHPSGALAAGSPSGGRRGPGGSRPAVRRNSGASAWTSVRRRAWRPAAAGSLPPTPGQDAR